MFLVLALYRLFRVVHEGRAVVMVVLALLCVPISFVAEVNSLAVLRVLGGVDVGAFSEAQRQAQAMLFLDMHRSGVLVAQVFWGLWLLVLGSLVFRSGFLPRLLGVSVMIGAAGYLLDSGAHLLGLGVPAVSQ